MYQPPAAIIIKAARIISLLWWGVHGEPCLLLLAGFLCERMIKSAKKEHIECWRAMGWQLARPSIDSYLQCMPRPTLSPPLMRFMPHHCWILSFLPVLNTDPPLYYDCSSMRTFPFHVLLLRFSLWIASIDWRNSIARLDLWHWWLKIDGRWNRLRLLSSEVLIDVV